MELAHAGVGYVEVEEVIRSSLLAQGLAVAEEFHLGQVGVHGDLGHVLHAIHIALAADVNEGIVAQPGLVGIEGVLLVLAVDGHQTLVVLAVLATLGTVVGAEVEHVPHMGGPDVLAGEQLLDQLFVEEGLIFLGVVTLGGLGGVPVQGFAAVLGHAHRDVGVLGVELIEPGAVHGGVAAVPAEVVVPAHHVGDLDVLSIHAAHGHDGHGGEAGLVHLMHQIVQNAMVLQQVGILGTLHGDLVGETPHHDGGVVVVLGDQFLHLGDGVLAALGHVLGDVGDLSPILSKIFSFVPIPRQNSSGSDNSILLTRANNGYNDFCFYS